MAASGGFWAPAAMSLLRIAVRQSHKAANMVRTKIAGAARQVNSELGAHPTSSHPSGVRNAHSSSGHHQPIHPAALLRQQRRAKWLSGLRADAVGHVQNAVRRYLSTGGTATAASRSAYRAIDRAALPASRTSGLVGRLSGRAPFASALRPNLTGGALPRTAGGYAVGAGAGAARYFSHSPAAPAQVVHNVSAACRAFWLSGQRARFDGCDARGNATFRAVSADKDAAHRKMERAAARAFRENVAAKGAYVDFRLSPTLTALSPLAAAASSLAALAATQDGSVFSSTSSLSVKPTKKASSSSSSPPATLLASGFLDELAADFSRALSDLTLTMRDVRALSALGDLPVSVLDKGRTLRVRFPGVDAESVERLCDDAGVTRGVVGQDDGFVDHEAVEREVGLRLRFPFAPGVGEEGEGREGLGSAFSYQQQQHGPPDDDAAARFVAEKTLTSPGGSLRSLDGREMEEAYLDAFDENPWLLSSGSRSPMGVREEGYESLSPPAVSSGEHCSEDFEGLEGIYRFLEECDNARGGF